MNRISEVQYRGYTIQRLSPGEKPGYNWVIRTALRNNYCVNLTQAKALVRQSQALSQKLKVGMQ